MFARIPRIQTHLDRADEAAKLFEEKVIPIIKNTNIAVSNISSKKSRNIVVAIYTIAASRLKKAIKMK